MVHFVWTPWAIFPHIKVEGKFLGFVQNHFEKCRKSVIEEAVLKIG